MSQKPLGSATLTPIGTLQSMPDFFIPIPNHIPNPHHSAPADIYSGAFIILNNSQDSL